MTMAHPVPSQAQPGFSRPSVARLACPPSPVPRDPWRFAVTILAPLLGLVTACRSPEGFSRDLPHAIPTDAQIFVQSRDTEQDRALRKVYADAWSELRKSKFLEEFAKALAKSTGQDSREWSEAAARLLDSAESLPFEECSAGEGVFGLSLHPRLAEDGGDDLDDFDIGVNLVGVHQIDPATSGALGDRLAAHAATLEETIPGLHATDQTTGGIRVISLTAEDQEVPIGLHVAVWDRYVLLATRRPHLRAAIDGLRGSMARQTVRDRAALREAVASLPSPGAELSHVAVDDLIQSYLGFLDTIASRKGGDEARHAIEMVRGFTDELRIFDSVTTTSAWHKDLRREEKLVQLRDDSSERILQGLLFQDRVFSGWKEWIPADATSFAVWAGPEPARLYEALVGIVERHAGHDAVQQWDDLQEEAGFVVARDLPLAALTGNVAVMSFPAGASSSPFGGGGEWAVLLETWDQEQAWSKVEALLGRLQAFIEKESGGEAASMVRFEEVPVSGGGGMRSIQFVPFPFVTPVIGVTQGQVILASSSKTASKVLGRLRSEGESIETNPKLRELGLAMPDAVYAASFSDLEGSMRKVSDGLQAMGMATAFLPPGSTDESVRRILRLVPRLAPAVRKLDVRLARASVSWLDSGNIRSTTVTRYALPGAKPSASKPPASTTVALRSTD